MTRLPPSSAPRRFFYAAGGGRGSRRWIAACLVFFSSLVFSRWEWKISFVSFFEKLGNIILVFAAAYSSFLSIRD